MIYSGNNLKGALMIQGTTSDAGKSICVAGLCRILYRRGISVAPFKPQNMALNSAVTASGGEIGRAQALQAVACGLEPATDFNPVLLKPSTDMKSQVIIHGKAVSQLDAKTFGNIKALAFEQVLESYRKLRESYDVVLIEGAGSPAEINLRENDIANMGFAEAVDCPVVLISDIDRGGVFAHLTGTVNLLSPSEQARIKGFIINKFRGRLSLLQSGVDWLEEYSQRKVYGVVPYLSDLKLDAEDAINPDSFQKKSTIKVKVPVLTRISNHTDFDPLKWHEQVEFEFVRPGETLQGADLIILPGSKSVIADMKHVIAQGWDKDIEKHLRYGGKLLGICGGFQMLGNLIEDEEKIESEITHFPGLRLLDFSTRMQAEKQLTNVSGECHLLSEKATIRGYEIHCGVSQGKALAKPFCRVRQKDGDFYSDGVISEDGQIAGTYLHGLFEQADTLQLILKWVSGETFDAKSWNDIRESELDRLADCYEECLDLDSLFTTIA
ncbi:cobyric acid synthase [Aliikangiella sp. G2MR2-5]|uniref:cobyric acid synthase n=1 Tax=Aliikangiella sp. G2MR2-5 TaxID=2788943 RepID=UPI0018A883E2|nr:cobyric acid synthase [Aliikangiella sp. G2MR2-5]